MTRELAPIWLIGSTAFQRGNAANFLETFRTGGSVEPTRFHVYFVKYLYFNHLLKVYAVFLFLDYKIIVIKKIIFELN